MNYISIMKVFIGLVDHSRGIIQAKSCIEKEGSNGNYLNFTLTGIET